MATVPDPEQVSIDDARIFTLSTNFAREIVNGTKKSIVRFALPGILTAIEDIKQLTVRLRSAIIPNVFPNINNATLYITYYYNSVPLLIVLPIVTGYYDIYDLVDALNDALASQTTLPGGVAAMSSLFLFDYDEIRNKIYTQAKTFPAQVAVVLVASDLTQQMGLDIGEVGIEILPNAKQYAVYGPRLQGVTNILIQSPDIPTSNYSTELDTSIFGAIPVSVPQKRIMHWANDSQVGFPISPTTLIENLTFYLLDQNGEPLDFQNYDWTMQFELVMRREEMPQFEDFQTSLQRILQTYQQQNAEQGYPTQQVRIAKEEQQLFYELQRPQSIREYEEALEKVMEQQQKHTE
jgi:hypothetical protein